MAGGEDISELLALADTLFREKYAEGRKYYDLFPEMIAATRLIYQIPVLAHRGKQALSWLATARRVLLSLPGGYGKTQFELLCENVSQLHPDEAVRNLVNTLYMGGHSPDDE
ncbi:hypothetical protein LJC04_06030 [Ruminococcaceae bacterium OttesenSCG-928-O06]|nr:hypothetical protein [Ruminococcaceae bacterium OttesenSCG-928-O06]